MFRYIRLFAHFFRFSASRALEFRIDFWFRFVMDAVYYATSIAFFKVLYLHTGEIGGWSEEQALIFVAGTLVLDALQMTLVSNNVWMLGELVNKGTLDYYLIRPVSSLFFVSLREVAFNSLLNLVLASGILAWALMAYTGPISLIDVVVYVFLIINGTFLFHAIRFLMTLPIFWTQAPRSALDSLFWTCQKFMERPDAIYPRALRLALITLLPYSLMVSLPTRYLFGDNKIQILALCVTVSVGFAIALRITWRRALRVYASAAG